MADNTTVDNGDLTDFSVSTDEGAGGHVQRFKLAYSADGSETHVTADASGLLVNLGSNNDVTLTSGTLTAIAGTVTTSVAGTASVNATLQAGAALAGYVGVTDATGTSLADILALTSGTAIAVGIYDDTGTQLPFAAPAVVSATPTLGAGTAYADGDSMGSSVLSFASATVTSGGSGHIVKAMCIDDDDQGQNIDLWLFQSSVTPASDNAAHALADSDLDDCVGVVSLSTWYDATNGKIAIERIAPPLAFNTSGSTTLYGIPVSRGTGTYTASGLEFKLHIIKD